MAEASDDRRDFPRIETEHSVEVVDADGGVFPALALDLSLTGMQLLCDEPTAKRLLPQGSPDPQNPQKIDVRIRLKLRDGTRAKIRAEADMMSLRSNGEDDQRIGLRFRNFFGDSYHALESYIDESLPD